MNKKGNGICQECYEPAGGKKQYCEDCSKERANARAREKNKKIKPRKYENIYMGHLNQ